MTNKSNNGFNTWQKSFEKETILQQSLLVGKRFKVLIISARGEKVHKGVGISKTSISNSFPN